MATIAAEEIMPRFGKLGADESWDKRPGSVVTIADRRAEERLARALSDHLPGSLVVGEEGCEDDPTLLTRIPADEAVWLVDPIDGTANYAAGRPEFVVMVALVVGGEVRAGWIHRPTNGESVVAEEGAGAYRGNARLRVAAAVTTSGMTGSLGPRLRRNGALCAQFAKIGNSACCGIEYLGLADGIIHFAHYRRLKPWDHAAGTLIHREAGGHGSLFDGTPYRPWNAPDRDGLLLAPDAESWRRLATVIGPAVAALP